VVVRYGFGLERKVKLNASLLKQDLYRVLGVARGASHDEIRRRYRHLVRVSHPDRHPLDERSAALRMAEINVAASILLDPQRRADYDRARAQGGAREPSRSWGRTARAAGYSVDPAPGVCSAWATRQARRGLGREQRRVLETLRPWASRQFEALSLWHAEQPPRSQLAFFVATITLALFLIGAARPRPIWEPPGSMSRAVATARPGPSG
jgi:hypothetical protein